MNFHHDAVRVDRLTRRLYISCDWLCAVLHLSNVEPDTRAFRVVPGSNRFASLAGAHKPLGRAFRELPLYGRAGTCVLYDTATFHARGGWLKSMLPEADR